MLLNLIIININIIILLILLLFYVALIYGKLTGLCEYEEGILD